MFQLNYILLLFANSALQVSQPLLLFLIQFALAFQLPLQLSNRLPTLNLLSLNRRLNLTRSVFIVRVILMAGYWVDVILRVYLANAYSYKKRQDCKVLFVETNNTNCSSLTYNLIIKIY